MKIQGRFIAVLAVLGLLIALLPLAPAGAVTGTVKLIGGAEKKGQYFSDQTDYNVLRIEVKDADLTPLRVGTARDTDHALSTINLVEFVVAGEKDRTERFDGGEDNPICDVNGTNPTDETQWRRPTSDTERQDSNTDPVPSCVSRGDAMVTDTVTSGESTGDATWTFTLDEPARDRQSDSQEGVGVNEIKDIISVVVNGRSAAPATDNATPTGPEGTGPWYSVTVGTIGAGVAEVPGGGITAVTIHRLAPQDAENSVSVTYSITEFDFGDDNASPAVDSTTPLSLADSSVRYGGDGFATAVSQVTLSTVSDTTINLTSATSAHTVVTFAYDVKDEEDELVTLNSGTAGDRKLDAVETAAGSDTFEASVAIFSQEDYTKITTQAGNDANDDGGTTVMGDEGVVNVDELNATNGLTGADESGERTLAARVTAASTALEIPGSAPASDFVARIVPARHGDTINVVYADANPSIRVSKTATVDLEAPNVTLISPADGFYTNATTVTLSADVKDLGAGVAENKIDLKIQSTGVSYGPQIRTPIDGGYRVQMNPEGTISEGTKEWFVAVQDKVGNEPAMDDPDEEGNQAPKGAGAFNASTADNPFKFTVDTKAPALATGETGLYLKNPGVTSGADKETQRSNSRTWIRVVFDAGDGTAPLDPSTVEANDFRVDDLAPLAAKINAVTHDDGETLKGTAVYLQVGQMDTDDRPEVVLSGEIKDRAGNIRSEGRLTSIADGLNPILEVTPSTSLAESEVTVSITSSETLRSNPVVDVTTTKPVKGEDLVDTDSLRVSLVVGNLTSWTATFKNQVGQASRQYVVVTGTDIADNSVTVGDATNEDDIVTFQVDDSPPSLMFKDPDGNDLEDEKQTEGAVWIVAEFDEDEHADDKSRGVTVTDLTLTNLADDSVVTTDASAVFDTEAACTDHEDETTANKCAERTLAVNLGPGNYNVRVTGADAMGNEVTGDTDFTVIEAKPFELDLRPGVNFISIPGMPMADGGDINVMLGGHPVTTVSTYDRSLELQGQNPWLRATKDAETGMFSGDITMIEPGKAYFITATASSTVEIKIQQAVVELPPTIAVRQGFNAIGFWSPSGAASAKIDDYLNSIGWTVAYSYDPTPGKGWDTIRRGETDDEGIGRDIEEGKGYLVYATYDAVLTP